MSSFIMPMKSKAHLLLALFTALTFSGCKIGKGDKPLIGYHERRPAVEQTTEAAAPDETEESKPSNRTAAADGLEIPATSPSIPEQILYRTGYTVSYNREWKIPNWVAWHLSAAHTEGRHTRKGIPFQEDTDVPMPRATDSDYYNSGYDRGHLCPSADNRWDAEAQRESFLFTNICPQNHGLNAGDWNELEIQCRQWAKAYQDVYIVSGPLVFKNNNSRIGRNKVTVPDAFFKVVLRLNPTPAAIAFICRNKEGNRPKRDYVNSLKEAERLTGFKFFPKLPDEVKKRIENNANLNDWR
ncbi:MAG: DNA/RNA non-specific endonuclease [Prevotella sp.]|nr:DNA/RNA non-specific endonuclease [Prevotella sp.]MDY2633680.1 DNA/RNA non-specific endonuclease [Prevotella sp.]